MRKKALITDDSILMRRLLSDLIENLDYDVDFAFNGQELVEPNRYNFKRFHSAIGYQKPMNLYLEFIKNVG